MTMEWPHTPDRTRRQAIRVCAGAAVKAALGAGAFGVFAAVPTRAAHAQVPGVFNSVEIPKKGLEPFPKWTEALARSFAEIGKIQQEGCDPITCSYATWAQMIGGLQGKPLEELLKGVNDFLNQAPYVVDQINYGIKDYWSSPGEFFRQFGDCEDYAISKFLSLRILGVPAVNMRVVVVQDLNLKVGHAALAVFLWDGSTMILDNQIAPVVRAETIHHYQPLFSLNESGWWLHRAAG